MLLSYPKILSYDKTNLCRRTRPKFILCRFFVLIISIKKRLKHDHHNSNLAFVLLARLQSRENYYRN